MWLLLLQDLVVIPQIVQDISAENATKPGSLKERFETGELVQSIAGDSIL